MPDRYDPKLSVRAMGDRKSSEAPRGNKAPGEDPLFELAKIVSGRSTATSQPRTRTVPAAAAAKPAEAPDVLGDLEAELLSDLQASFSTVRGAAAAAPSPVTRGAPPARAEAPPRDVAHAPRAKATEPPPRPPKAEGSPERPERRAEAATAEPPTSSPSSAQTAGEPAKARLPVVERAQPRAGAQQAKPAAPRSSAERPAHPPRVAAPSDSVDIPNLHLRSTTPAAPPPPPEAPLRQPHSRWDKPPEPEKSPSSVASRFAPPKAVAPVPAEPVADEEDSETLAEGFPFAPDDDTAEAETPFDEFDLGPGYGEDDHLPPYPDDELESLVQRRPRRGRIALVAVVAVVLIGGGALLLFRANGTGDSPPPIITADGSPTKITPEEDGVAPDGDQNKLIYDRVASGEIEPDTTLITPGDEPVAEVPPADAGTDSPITRVIIPGGPGIDRPEAGVEAGTPDANDEIGTMIDAGGSEPAAEQSEIIQPIGPRKVRTVVVKPDGTIVSNETAEATTDTTPGGVNAAAEPEPVVPAAPAPTDNDTVAIAGVGGGTDAGGELAITPVPDLREEPDVAAPGNNAGASTPPPAPTVEANNEEPIDITPGRPPPRSPAPAPAETAATTVSTGLLVQVSSQRSEDAARATFRDLQSRYPSILGNYEVNIQRADLGERGIYYRARVGPFSPGDADRLCSDLKAAGGDCILARR